MEKLIQTYLNNLLHIPSPTGDTAAISTYIQSELKRLKYSFTVNKYNDIRVEIGGDTQGDKLTWISHMDTLGVEVKERLHHLPKPYAYVLVKPIGGFMMVDAMNADVTFQTPTGEITGTLVQASACAHVGTGRAKRQAVTCDDEWVCRLDTNTAPKKGAVGTLLPYTQWLKNGLIKGRFLDSQADVATLLAVLETWKTSKFQPKHPIDIVINTREEVAITCPLIAEDTHTCIGLEWLPQELGCPLDEIGVITKDSRATSTPETVAQLKAAGIKNTASVPRFGSDATIAKKAGAKFNVATIGPGINNSHGMERMHMDGLVKLAEFVAKFTL